MPNREKKGGAVPICYSRERRRERIDSCLPKCDRADKRLLLIHTPYRPAALKCEVRDVVKDLPTFPTSTHTHACILPSLPEEPTGTVQP